MIIAPHARAAVKIVFPVKVVTFLKTINVNNASLIANNVRQKRSVLPAHRVIFSKMRLVNSAMRLVQAALRVRTVKVAKPLTISILKPQPALNVIHLAKNA